MMDGTTARTGGAGAPPTGTRASSDCKRTRAPSRSATSACARSDSWVAPDVVARATVPAAISADRDQARWARALALHHLGRSREALADYERVAEGAVLPRLRAGAHEAAAVVSEKLGDYPNAIRHYFALEYRSDYGYLIDCLASPDDLRAFLSRFPGHPRARLVEYSLGFRQLRLADLRQPGSLLESRQERLEGQIVRLHRLHDPLQLLQRLFERQVRTLAGPGRFRTLRHARKARTTHPTRLVWKSDAGSGCIPMWRSRSPI